MKVVVVIPYFYPAFIYGGPVFAAYHLSQKAAENGVVVYAGNDLPGFGNLLLVKHANGYVTAYAHTQSFLVKQGSRVKRGQVIAKSGKSGNVVEPQLHFEIRQGSRAINPQKLLT